MLLHFKSHPQNKLGCKSFLTANTLAYYSKKLRNKYLVKAYYSKAFFQKYLGIVFNSKLKITPLFSKSFLFQSVGGTKS
jgi:hypothetical protein